MRSYIQILLLIICGIILLWLGFFLFFGKLSPFYSYLPWNKKKTVKGKPGNPQVCPVCSTVMYKGDLVKTVAFAPGAKSIDRLVHIKGCYYCLEKGLPRKCPVCQSELSLDDFLVSRMFERSFRRNHIHILGCNKCRKI